MKPLVDEVRRSQRSPNRINARYAAMSMKRDLTEIDSYRRAARLEGIGEAELERRHGVLVEVSLRDDQHTITIRLTVTDRLDS